MTIEEVRNGIAQNPDLKAGLLTELESELPAYLQGKGHIVRTATEQAEWEKQFETEKVGKRAKELYEGIEGDALKAFEHIGLKKESNTERAFDLVKKAGTMSQAKIADLEAKLADALAGKGDEVTKKQVEALQAELATAKADKDSLSTSFTQKELAWKAGHDQEKAFAELQIAVPAHVAETDKADFIASKRSQLLTTLNSLYKVEERDGKLVYTKDGEVQMKGANIATAKDLLEVVGKYDFAAPQKGGSGSQGGTGDNVSDYAGVTDKDSLYAAAAKKGFVLGSTDWTKFVNDGAKAKGVKLD